MIPLLRNPSTLHSLPSPDSLNSFAFQNRLKSLPSQLSVSSFGFLRPRGEQNFSLFSLVLRLSPFARCSIVFAIDRFIKNG
ncbi:hypothetical protein Nepgr_016800 [Nepenthes gracilis]|uniref:Uncharacterized protein n=1 Tax=Nepenthes gracilis TaxID=150966 RepID=A0AAD3SQD3_NEPGR|nr:hypothetical protein Nepgr_016800 [Nepenthes gracilis]